jgi:hypothetical protein
MARQPAEPRRCWRGHFADRGFWLLAVSVRAAAALVVNTAVGATGAAAAATGTAGPAGTRPSNTAKAEDWRSDFAEWVWLQAGVTLRGSRTRPSILTWASMRLARTR